jgi:hypothetical protein
MLHLSLYECFLESYYFDMIKFMCVYFSLNLVMCKTSVSLFYNLIDRHLLSSL